MREQVERLRKLATELLDLSRLEAGSLELRPEPTDVGAARARRRRRVHAGAPRSTTPTSSCDLPARADRGECDPERVAQIVRILLDNALAHTPAGTGRRRFGARARTGRSASRSPTTASGIRRQTMPHIFEPFFTSADGAQGAGLGLAIARELAERMSGELAVALGARAHRRSRWSCRHERALAGCSALRGAARRAAAAAAHGGDDQDGEPRARRRSTTRVRGRSRAQRRRRLRPAARSTSAEAPGVVTVMSLFGGERLDSLGAAAGRPGGVGSGFVVSRDGEIATNAHVVTTGEGAEIQRAPTRSTSSSPTATRSQAKIVGHDPNADVALLKVDPAGPDAAPAAARRERRQVQVGDAGGGDRLARSASSSRCRSAWSRRSTARSTR